MTFDRLLPLLSSYQGVLIAYCAVIPVLAFAMGFLHSVYGGRRPPWNGLYALLLYLVAIPTAIILAVSGYLLFFGTLTFGELSFVPTYVPIISFLLTALLVKRAVDYYYVPAMLNPLGLLILMLLSLSGALYVYHTEAFLLLGRPLATAAVVSVVPFLLLRGVLGRIFGRRE